MRCFTLLLLINGKESVLDYLTSIFKGKDTYIVALSLLHRQHKGVRSELSGSTIRVDRQLLSADRLTDSTVPVPFSSTLTELTSQH